MLYQNNYYYIRQDPIVSCCTYKCTYNNNILFVVVIYWSFRGIRLPEINGEGERGYMNYHINLIIMYRVEK